MSQTRVSIDGPVATLSLARPEARNALSIELCDEIVASLAGIDEDPEARVVVLAGEGKVFCAGADLAAVSGPGGIDFLPAFERMLDAVARFRLPVIARLHGVALGGGLQLATACDFRIAAEDATFGIPSSRLGIVLNFENVQRLVFQVGAPVAKQVLMTARTYSGIEAEVAGLVTEAVAPDHLDAAVGELATSIAGLAPLSVQGAKAEINAVTDQFVGRAGPDVAAAMAELVAEAYNSADLQEGIDAMTSKRPPTFHGR